MGWIGLIVVLLILGLGTYYIYTVNRVTNMDSAARNRAGDIDTVLWDRNHSFEGITAILKEKEIPLDEKMTEPLALTLGMPPSLQMANHTELHRRRKELDKILEEHPELSEDEALTALITKFDGLRTELVEASKRYNASARDFNGYIEKGFPSFIAARKTKGVRSFFSLDLAEVSVK